MDHAKMIQALAVILHGLESGALLFGSFVSVRSFNVVIKEKDGASTIKKLFPTWWPAGRDLMAPLTAIAGLLHGATYYKTGASTALAGCIAMFFVLMWTVTVMKESISALRKANNDKVLEMVLSFGRLHHVRSLVSVAAYMFLVISKFAT